ncbi:bifunctional riboflavin kinase/FAD synthetase [Arachidicoccus soli]|uniref:Riboflavin biosynthesis protein n=1 Tax=Arachidicoccus soli TaxID=2341117 RepID=A0A386HL90_9BACT|nr:bifunctional riboflavin kinase/FAD synthetase [Arachidicoccus soli]AYD46545.1 bifunctional riboflavin kinase/FAD synthetase [Arachidicoccus soli]
MRVFYDLNNLPEFINAVVTIGTFDGVHLGHQKIITQLKEEAKKINGETVIVTFFPHPRKIVHQGQKPFHLLNTLSEKIKLLGSFGVDNVIVIPFNEAFAAQTAEEYVRAFLVEKTHPHTIIVGYDHRFGKDRTGDYHTLENYGKEFGFCVKEIPEKLLNEVTISSTRIREALMKGAIEDANHFLGYHFFFEGKVIRGNQLGRTIGYPTANLQIEDADKLVPANGVYAVCINDKDDQNYGGMLNIGVRPTVDGTKLSIEVNIFDFDKDIYGDILRVETIARLRDEVKFSGLDALKTQLANDKDEALTILKK